MHIDNKNKDILILGEGPTRGLDDTTLTAEVNCPINFPRSGKRYVLSLYYNRSNSFLYVNATKIYPFKAKDSEMKDYTLCLDNVSKDFTIDNMKKKAGLKKTVKVFSVNYNAIDTYDILKIRNERNVIYNIVWNC